MLAIISVHHPIPTHGNRKNPGNFQKTISGKLSFQLSVQAYSLLGQTEGEEEDLFWRVQEGGHIVRLLPRALSCHKR